MRTFLPVSLSLLLAACGQTGPLYLPEEPVDTAVEIRPGPAPASPEGDRKEEESTASGEADEAPSPERAPE